LPKLKVVQREQVKQWIRLCGIRGLSLQETMDFVNSQLPPEYHFSYIGIRSYINVVKKEARNWMDVMACDGYNFVYELKQRWDQVQEINRRQWQALENAENQGDIEAQAKMFALLSKTNDQLLQMLLLLPQVKNPHSLELESQVVKTQMLQNQNQNQEHRHFNDLGY
jgi:hypothetical protein